MGTRGVPNTGRRSGGQFIAHATALFIVFLGQAAFVQPAGAQDSPGTAKQPRDPTEELFVAKCSSCHTVGAGARVGPDLKGAHTRRDRVWLEKIIATPNQLLDSDPDARALVTEYKGVRMPDLGLKPEQAKALVDLIARCSSQPCDLTAAFVPASKATPQDIARGRQLFTGEAPLKNGGAPCLSCHTVSGLNLPMGGGTLARDISQSFARLGDEGIDSSLKSPPFALMNKVFSDHPLEADEAFALRAFLYDRNRAAPDGGRSNGVPLVGLLASVLVLTVLRAVWARQTGSANNTHPRSSP
ncbi:MAG: cytochrome c [Polyangiaceae bacterium]|nr:cytochrome c [Polyangiaceae bacterium]